MKFKEAFWKNSDQWWWEWSVDIEEQGIQGRETCTPPAQSYCLMEGVTRPEVSPVLTPQAWQQGAACNPLWSPLLLDPEAEHWRGRHEATYEG